MSTFSYPALRSGLALAAALFVAGGAQAQSITGRVPVPSAAVTNLGDAPAEAVQAPPSNRLAVCTAAQTVTQGFVTNFTFVAPTGNTASPTGTPQELGQSFTVPCDGFLSSFAVVAQAAAAQSASGTVSFYTGAGTAGALLTTAQFAFNLPSAGAFNLPISLPRPLAVTQGQVITAFIDITGVAVSLQLVSPGTYPDGVMYFSGTGSAPGATPEGDNATGDDLRFTATFNPPSAATTSTTATTPTVFNGAGYRLLSPPVSGITIADLATQNLVQGVAAGDPPQIFPPQYPTASPNIFTAYSGTGVFGGFLAPASTAQIPPNGRGFFWYWYDRAITPDPASFGGGTSTSRELTGFTLSATGVAPSANVTRQVATSSTGAYMLGNPFGAPFQLSGLSVTLPAGSTLGTVFSIWDPSVSSYVTKGPSDFVAVWQGFFAQVTGATNPVNPTFVYNIASTNASATPPFYGRSGALADTGVQFRLDGATTAGETHDLAATVRFLPDALLGNDRHDGSKLLPPGGAYALLAPVGEFDGAPARLSVNSLPDALADVLTVPLAFLATDGGTFTLTWENTLVAGRAVMLRDVVTGSTVDLTTETSYTFASDATDWAARFELVVGRGAVAGEGTPNAVRVGTFAPNPATGASRLSFTTDAAQSVRAVVLDALGREVAVVFESSVAPGAETTVAIDAGRLSPGTYVVRVTGDTFTETRRLTVVR